MGPNMPVPGIVPGTLNPNAGAEFVWAINNSAGTIEVGDVMVMDPTAANNVAGKPVSTTTTTTANDRAACGAVAPGQTAIAVGAGYWLQVGGLHLAVKCDGTTDLVNGDFLSTFTTAKRAAKADAGNYMPLGRYVDAAYTTNDVAAKKVVLLNPSKLRGIRL